MVFRNVYQLYLLLAIYGLYSTLKKNLQLCLYFKYFDVVVNTILCECIELFAIELHHEGKY